MTALAPVLPLQRKAQEGRVDRSPASRSAAVRRRPFAAEDPSIVAGPVLGVLRGGRFRFPYRCEAWAGPGEHLRPWYAVALGPRLAGEIQVRRDGPDSDGPWGVDIVLTLHTSPLTPALAREWSAALDAAAALAEELNRPAIALPR